MSNTTIEKNIVQLEFDAKKFRDGVKKSTDDLSEFKRNIDFTKSEQAFANLDKVAKIDFSTMANSLESINSKLSIMGVAAGVIIAKITEAVIGGAKKLAGTVLFGAAADGFGEYETQLNAVQTILANTAKAGTNLQDVTDALDELNEYADLTIYNFTEMTKNIGTFTAAGVDLDTSVQAIKGIANLAAVSGSSSVQAATAMYQLSQALSTGTVKLMDWNSVQSAGLGGQLFQDALITTAKVHRVAVSDMTAAQNDFRGSLNTGWLSSEILLETLSQFTGDLTDSQLESMGYTAEQIVEIQKLAVIANDAATKVKTFTALKDTLGEALGSGWATSWRLIFGDFEQAKELWGGVAGLIGGVIDASSDARNNLLETWERLGGRNKLVSAFMDMLGGMVGLLDRVTWAFREVFGSMDVTDLFQITYLFQRIGWFLSDAGDNSRRFGNSMRGLFAAIAIVFMVVKAVLKPIVALIGTLFKGSGSVLDFTSGLGTAIFQFKEFAENTGFFDKVVADVIEKVGEFIDKVRSLVDAFLELKLINKVVQWLQQLDKGDWLNVLEVAKTILTALIAPFYLLAVGAQMLYAEIVKLKIVKDIVAWFNNIDWQATAQYFRDMAVEIGDFFAEIRDGGIAALGDFNAFIEETIVKVKELWEEFQNSDVLESFLGLVNTFDGRRIKQFGADAKEGFSWIDGLKESKFGLWAAKTFDDAGAKAKEFGAGLLEALTEAFNYLAENADNIDYSHLFDIINTGLLAGAVLSIRKIASGDFLSGAIDDSDFGEGIIDVFDKLEGTIGSFQNNIRADTLQKIAISIALLAASVFLLTLIDSTKLTTATASIAAMLLVLFGASGALKMVKPQDAIKSAVAIVGLSIAVGFMALALKVMSGIDADAMEQGIGAIIASLIVLVGAVRGMKTGKGTLKSILVMQGLALALLGIWGVVKLFGETDPVTLGLGLASVAASVAILTGSLAILSKTGGDKNSSLKASIAMLAIAKSLDKLHEVVVKFGTTKWEIIRQGLAVVAGVMAGMALFSKFVKTDKILQAAGAMLVMGIALLVIQKAVEAFGKMNLMQLVVGLVAITIVIVLLAIAGKLMTTAMPGALAMIVMAGALVILGVALKIIGGIPIHQLIAALAAIAIALLIFIVAGYLLAPIVIVLMAFGLALMMMGAGAALFGFGIFLAATGLAALAGAFVLVGSALAVIGPAIVQWVPKMAIAIAEGITQFIITIAEKIPEIVKAGKDILLAIIEGFTTLLPDIMLLVGQMIVDFLQVIVDLLPDIIQAGYDILLGIMKGIEDNIKDIVTTALSIITQFIEGITEGLPQIVESAVELYFTFLETIESEVITQKNIERVMEIGFSIAGNIIQGLINGLGAGAGRIWTAIQGLIGGAKNEMEEGFEEESPSKWTYRVGKNLIAGLVNSIRHGVTTTRGAISDFVRDSKKQFDPLISLLSDELNDAIELRPLISPVMDLSSVTAGAGLIQSAFGNVSISSDLASIGVRTSDADGDGLDNDDDGKDGVVYNQYNYSPKALDRAEIYRQTRTQVANLSRKVFEK